MLTCSSVCECCRPPAIQVYPSDNEVFALPLPQCSHLSPDPLRKLDRRVPCPPPTVVSHFREQHPAHVATCRRRVCNHQRHPCTQIHYVGIVPSVFSKTMHHVTLHRRATQCRFRTVDMSRHLLVRHTKSATRTAADNQCRRQSRIPKDQRTAGTLRGLVRRRIVCPVRQE